MKKRGFLKVAHSLLSSPLGSGASVTSHLQPTSVLALVVCTLEALVVELWRESHYPLSVFWRSWWWAWALFPFLPPCGHRLCESILPQLLCCYFSSLPECSSIPSFIHLGWDPDVHFPPPRRSFQPKGLASISSISSCRLRSDYKLTADDGWQECFWPDFEFCLPLRKKSGWYTNHIYTAYLYVFVYIS